MPGSAASASQALAQAASAAPDPHHRPASLKLSDPQGPAASRSLHPEFLQVQHEHGVHAMSPSKLHGAGGSQETATATDIQQPMKAQPAFNVHLGTAPTRILGATSASVLAATSAHAASSIPLPSLPPGLHAEPVTHLSASAAATAAGIQYQRGSSSSRIQQSTQHQLSGLQRDRAHTVDLACMPARFETSDSSDADCEEATRRLTAAFPNLSSGSRRSSDHWSSHNSLQPPSQQRKLGPDPEPASPSRILSSASSTCSDVAEALERRRQGRNNYHLTGQAAVELFMRLNHARQTLDFAKRQASVFSTMDRAQMDVWQALDKLNELREYEAALMSGSAEVHPDMTLKEHALQTAELCRLAHPDKDWLHLVGLMHGLGKLLAHQTFGAQPQWATCGESFPLGCRFDPSLQGTQFFSVNPDRRRRLYNTPLGIYRPACGLQNVYMSWSAAEYLYLMLLLNETQLPPEALFIIRHQKFTSLTKPGSSAYQQLLSNEDKALLPLLASFQQLSAYRRVALPDAAPDEGALRSYYQELIRKYIGDRQLSW